MASGFPTEQVVHYHADHRFNEIRNARLVWPATPWWKRPVLQPAWALIVQTVAILVALGT